MFITKKNLDVDFKEFYEYDFKIIEENKEI